MAAQGDYAGTGQGREIDDSLGFVASCIDQSISQYNPPLRIRVAHLDGDSASIGAAVAGHDITRPIAGIAGEVFCRGNDPHHMDR